MNQRNLLKHTRKEFFEHVMRVAILCDGDRSIGAGHFFRCSAVAYELLQHSSSVIFIIPSLVLEALVEQSKFPYKLVPELFDNSIAAAERVLAELESAGVDRILLDSHRVTKTLLEIIQEKFLTIYFDDLLMYPYPVNILVNFHVDASIDDYQNLYRYSDTTIPRFLIGTEYFPLKRSSYQKVCLYKNRKHVGFFAGGSDPDHVTLRMLKYILKNKILFKYTLHVVVGKMNTDYEEVKSLCFRNHNIQLYYGLSDLSGIYKQIDLAISAAGITLYELAYYGVPSVVYSMVDNQKHTAIEFARRGLSINIGDSRTEPIFPRMFETVQKMLDNDMILKTMSKKGSQIVDGEGAKRISDIIFGG